MQLVHPQPQLRKFQRLYNTIRICRGVPSALVTKGRCVSPIFKSLAFKEICACILTPYHAAARLEQWLLKTLIRQVVQIHS